MATIAELNIRLGLISKDFERGIQQVERTLRRSGQNLQSLGEKLTLAVSAPLAALGAAAIKQAGDLESLKLAMRSTFETAGRSIQAADAELEALRKSALAPGLDFEQAVKASIRLQGVEYSAEAARKTIEQMANAIALTGGTAENLDSVTVQFSQMIAKGKVLAQDLRIVQENMPIISKLMKQAFGTQNAEALQKMGISGREFVDKITAAAAELPRVEGGIKNALVNAGAAARQSLANLGDSISKAFNVSDLLNRFSAFVLDIADQFRLLDDGAKKFLLTAGSIAIAIGPVVKVVGLLISGIGALRGTIAGIGSAFASVYGGITKAAGAFSKLNDALKFGYITIAIAAAVALYNAWGYLVDKWDEANVAYKTIQSVQKQATASIAKEKSEVDLLVGVLNDENATREQKADALKKLQTISPQYFGSLKEENGLVVGLKDSYNLYIEALLKSARAAAAREKLIEVERRLLDITQERADLQQSSGGSARALAFAGLERQRQLGNLKDEEAVLQRQKKVLADIVHETESASNAQAGYNSTLTNAGPSAAQTEEALKKVAEKAKLYKDALSAISAVVQKGDVLGSEIMSEQAREIEHQIERLLDNGFKPYSKEIEHLHGLLVSLHKEQSKGFGQPLPTLPSRPIATSLQTDTGNIAPLPGLSQTISINTSGAIDAIEGLKKTFKGTGEVFLSTSAQIGKVIDDVNSKTISLTDSFDIVLKILIAGLTPGMQALVEVGSTLSSSIFDALANGTESFRTFASSALSSLGKVIQQILRAYIAQMLLNTAFFSKNPFLALALGAGIGAAANALFQRLAKKLSVPSLAEGGVATRPTLALIGDAGTGNPEIVTPERKLRQIFRNEGDGGPRELYSIIRGDDLLLTTDRAKARRDRIR